MGENFITYVVIEYRAFSNNLSTMLMSFMFNLMGSSLRLKSVFDNINNDIKYQNYVDIAT